MSNNPSNINATSMSFFPINKKADWCHWDSLQTCIRKGPGDISQTEIINANNPLSAEMQRLSQAGARAARS